MERTEPVFIAPPIPSAPQQIPMLLVEKKHPPLARTGFSREQKRDSSRSFLREGSIAYNGGLTPDSMPG